MFNERNSIVIRDQKSLEFGGVKKSSRTEKSREERERWEESIRRSKLDVKQIKSR